MRPLLLASAAVAALAARAGAQFGDAGRAFESAVTPWIGPMSFGNRLQFNFIEARYRSSIAAGARAELPLTRRLGAMANVGVAPFSRQQTEDPNSRQVFRANTIVYRADAGLSWRFKPRAPIFFYAGGGVTGASRYAMPADDLAGSVIEPQAAFALGYDAGQRGRWNFRVVYAGYVVFPTSTASEIKAKGAAYDWAVQLGARYSFRAAPPATR
jgi:hypothetical protein